MDPKTKLGLDKQGFSRVLDRAKDFSRTKSERRRNPAYATDYPVEIGLQLTYACNLRCKMCYQWNDEGYFHDFSSTKQRTELSTDAVEKIIRETMPAKSRIYLWGGEPMFHSEFDKIADVIHADSRWTTLCTNGLLIVKHMDSLLKMSSNLALLVSIDGLYEDNDVLRGNKVFERLIEQLDVVKEEKAKGNFKGKISINAVLNDNLAKGLYDFAQFWEEFGADAVYFNYPWYISPRTASKMDSFFEENFPELSAKNNAQVEASWHSYTFKLSDESHEIIKEQRRLLNQKRWNTRIHFQQPLHDTEILPFIRDEYTAPRSCYAVSNRIEVLSDGSVGTCVKFFPEFSVGNVNEESLISLWRSSEFNNLRSTVSKQLMPVCSKCVMLYRNGWKK